MKNIYYLQYASWWSIVASIKGKDYLIHFNRGASLMNVPIQVFESKVYVKDFTGISAELVAKWLLSPEVHYELEMSAENFVEPPVVTESAFSSVEIPKVDYMQWMKFDESPAGWHYSFTPTDWEIENLNVIDRSGKKYTFEMRDDVSAIRKAMMRYLKARKKTYSKREELTKDEMFERLTTLSNLANMSLSHMDAYLHNRHELFAMEVMASLGQVEASTDTRFDKYPGFKGIDMNIIKSNMTPDFIVEINDKIFVIECAVSDGKMEPVLREKTRKYLATVDYLNSKLADKEVKLAVVIFTDAREVFVSLEDEELEPIREIANYQSLLNLMHMVEAIPNYLQIRSTYNQIVEGNPNMDSKAVLETANLLIQALIKEALPTNALSINDSKEPKKVNQHAYFTKHHTKVVPEELIKFRETIRESSYNEPEFLEIVSENIRKGILTPEVKDMRDTERSKVADELDNKVSELIHEAEEYRGHIPKAFKVPFLHKSLKSVSLPFNYRSVFDFYDGTSILGKVFHGFEKDERRSDQYTGIGIQVGDISTMMDRIALMYTLDPDNKKTYANLVEMFEATEMSKVLKKLQDMMLEITRVSNRRQSIKKLKNKAVFRECDGFSLLIGNGDVLKADNQIAVKVFVDGKEASYYNTIARSFSVSECDDLFPGSVFIHETNWFTLQMADIEHYITIYSRAKVILSDMWCKSLESGSANMSWLDSPNFPELFQTPILIMLEHKRNTSTMCQLFRYLVHSATGLLSNTRALAAEIFETPIRSLIQGWVVLREAQWYSSRLREVDTSANFIINMMKSLETADRVVMPSLYHQTVNVEFSVIMMEMYYGNLFNPAHGFRGHRDKAILEKMLKIEDHYQSVISTTGVSRAWADVYYGLDNMCTYSPSFLSHAVDHYLSKEENKVTIAEAAVHALEFGYSKILKMTRSVIDLRDDYFPFAKYTGKLAKATVFEAIFEEISDLPEVKLVEIAKRDRDVFALFSTFSKDQIGNSREILIQAIRTRIHTAIINNFYEFLCKAHPKDMTTKEHQKREIQSSTILKNAEEMRKVNVTDDHVAIMLTINSDASKWAPSMVMDTYLLFVEKLRGVLPDHLLDYFSTIYSAYANKAMYIPNSLFNKLETWADSWIESDSIMSKVRRYASSTGLMVIHSGMGQGNFQHGSSFIHCIVDDYSDYLMERVLKNYGVVWTSRTLISSDDSTKMMLVSMPVVDNSSEILSNSIYGLTDMYTGLRKMANIHTNWKKTAVQVVITEFNSIFSILKRMCVASIKDSYNSVNVIDLTKPEEAVKEALSNVRRLLDSGCFIDTITTALEENRKNIISWYNISEEVMKQMKWLLDCSDEDLPFNLGFVPTTMPIETLIHGPEVHLGKEMSTKLKNFYKRVYSSNIYNTPDDSTVLDEESITKITLEVPYVGSAQLKELRKKVFSRAEIEGLKQVRMEVNRICLKSSSSLLYDFKLYLLDYITKVRATYAYSSTYRYHSMIRAMQYCDSITFSGKNEEKDSIISQLVKIQRLPIQKSYFDVFSDMKTLCDDYAIWQGMKATMRKLSVSRHPKMRTLTMYKRAITDVAQEEDIMKVIFASPADIRTSHYVAAKEVCDKLCMDIDQVLRDPVTEIKKRFEESPMLKFQSFVRWFCRLYQMKTVALISDFPTTWSRRLDTWQLYNYKSHPNFVYSHEDMDVEVESMDAMDNMMMFMTFSEMEERKPMISHCRNRKEKIYRTISEGKLIGKATEKEAEYNLGSYSPLAERPLFTTYKTRNNPHYSVSCWLSDIGMVEMIDLTHNRRRLKIYGKPTDMVWSVVRREVKRLDTMFPGIRWEFNESKHTKKITSTTKLLEEYNFRDMYSIKFYKFKLRVTKTFTHWQAIFFNRFCEMKYTRHEFIYHSNVSDDSKNELMIAHDTIQGGTLDLQTLNAVLKLTPRYRKDFLMLKSEERPGMDMSESLDFFTAITSAIERGAVLSGQQAAEYEFLLDWDEEEEEDEEEEVIGLANMPDWADDADSEVEAEEEIFNKLLITRDMIVDLKAAKIEIDEAVMEGGEKYIEIIANAISWAMKRELNVNLVPILQVTQDVAPVVSILTDVAANVLAFPDGTYMSELMALFIACISAKSNMLLVKFGKKFRVYKLPARHRMRFPHAVMSWKESIRVEAMLADL